MYALRQPSVEAVAQGAVVTSHRKPPLFDESWTFCIVLEEDSATSATTRVRVYSRPVITSSTNLHPIILEPFYTRLDRARS